MTVYKVRPNKRYKIKLKRGSGIVKVLMITEDAIGKIVDSVIISGSFKTGVTEIGPDGRRIAGDFLCFRREDLMSVEAV